MKLSTTTKSQAKTLLTFTLPFQHQPLQIFTVFCEQCIVVRSDTLAMEVLLMVTIVQAFCISLYVRQLCQKIALTTGLRMNSQTCIL